MTTQTVCPVCNEADGVRRHCKMDCGLLVCKHCEAFWTIDGHLVWNPQKTGA
jgi:hypothetical protein